MSVLNATISQIKLYKPIMVWNFWLAIFLPFFTFFYESLFIQLKPLGSNHSLFGFSQKYRAQVMGGNDEE